MSQCTSLMALLAVFLNPITAIADCTFTLNGKEVMTALQSSGTMPEIEVKNCSFNAVTLTYEAGSNDACVVHSKGAMLKSNWRLDKIMGQALFAVDASNDEMKVTITATGGFKPDSFIVVVTE